MLLAIPVTAWGAVSTVKLTASNKVVNSTVPLGSTASATFRLASAGKIRFQTSAGGLYDEQAPFDEWLEPESAIEALDYEVQAVPISGSPAIGPVNQWVPLGGVPRDWALTRSTVGTSQSLFTVQIRRTGAITVLASTTVTLRATVTQPPTTAFWLSSPGTHVVIQDIPKFEASGAVWDTSSGQLVVVSDQGDVKSSSGSQTSVGGDLEGIATSGDGFIYVAVEGGGPGDLGVCQDKTPQIVELYAPPFLPPPLSSLTGRSWKLAELPAKCAEGMEGLTWVPNGDHPYGNKSSGGVFYASSQRDGKIYIFDVNLTLSDTKPTLLNPGGFTPLSGEMDISDIYYDPSQKILFVLYDAANRLVQVDISKSAPAIISNGRLPLTPQGQEGITFQSSCNLSNITKPATIYLASDPVGNGYYSFDNFPGICSADSRKTKTITQTVPLSIGSMASTPVSVTVQNAGTTIWTGSTFGLFSIEGPSSGMSLGASESIFPGQTKTFDFVVPAFPTSGTHYLQWRMKEGSTWFGAPTPEVQVWVDIDFEPCPRC
jgi:hypothetical protein